jgi:hypothetical protein
MGRTPIVPPAGVAVAAVAASATSGSARGSVVDVQDAALRVGTAFVTDVSRRTTRVRIVLQP